jgi:hypothetical protein
MFTALILALALLPQPQKSLYAEWDYRSSAITEQQVNRFEVSLDGGPWIDAGRTASPDQTGVETGYVRYELKLPLVAVGPHLWEVRACNPLECGDPLQSKFALTLKPEAPVKARTSAREDGK